MVVLPLATRTTWKPASPKTGTERMPTSVTRQSETIVGTWVRLSLCCIKKYVEKLKTAAMCNDNEMRNRKK